MTATNAPARAAAPTDATLPAAPEVDPPEPVVEGAGVDDPEVVAGLEVVAGVEAPVVAGVETPVVTGAEVDGVETGVVALEDVEAGVVLAPELPGVLGAVPPEVVEVTGLPEEALKQEESPPLLTGKGAVDEEAPVLSRRVRPTWVPP